MWSLPNDVYGTTSEVAAAPLRGAAGASVVVLVPLAHKQIARVSCQLQGTQPALNAMQQNYRAIRGDSFFNHVNAWGLICLKV